MKVSELMIKNVVTADCDEHISKVLPKFENYGIHQMPVTCHGEYEGMIVLKDLLSAAYDPVKTKIGNFKISTDVLGPDDEIDDAVVRIVNSGHRALPVLSDGYLVGILSLTDLVKNVKYREEEMVDHFIKNVIKVKNVSNLGEALCLMDENNVSRLPVVNSEEEIVGCFDALSMVKFLKVPHESIRFSKLTAIEKESLRGFEVKNYMRPTATMDVKEFSASKIIERLQQHEEVILTENKSPVGIVIPKDLLKHAIVEDLPKIRISQYTKMDPVFYQRFVNLVEKFAKRFSRLNEIKEVSIHVNSHQTNGKGLRYYLKGKVITTSKSFPAKAESWNLIDTAHDLLGNLEKQLMKRRLPKFSGLKIKNRQKETQFAAEEEV